MYHHILIFVSRTIQAFAQLGLHLLEMDNRFIHLHLQKETFVYLEREHHTLPQWLRDAWRQKLRPTQYRRVCNYIFNLVPLVSHVVQLDKNNWPFYLL